MKILFYCEHGQKPEIGTGHLYRSKVIATELCRRKHRTEIIHDINLIKDAHVLVIDHIYSQQEAIKTARQHGMKVMLIDGSPDDVSLVDASVSAFFNDSAQHKGLKYMAFPTCYEWERYSASRKSKSVFVAMGGFDANNHAEMVIKALQDVGLYAIVAKSINHPNFKQIYPNVEMFEEENYYTAMKECIFGVVNGGLTLFQCLHYGLPCLAIPQYDHQKDNISVVSCCCLPTKPNIDDIKQKILWFQNSEYFRQDISKIAQHFVDGKAAARIAKIIEDIGG